MSADNNLCIGCGRTLEEIANWSTYDNMQKKRILNKKKNNIFFYQKSNSNIK